MPSKSPRTTGNAHYEIHVPTHDPHGNPLQDLSAVGHSWLYTKIPRLLHSVHTEGPHPGHPYRHMKVLAVDTPETDAHVKQMATNIGKLSGHPSTFLFKDGDQGIQPWTMRNLHYDGGPGHPEALQAPETIPQATVAPNTAY